MIPRRGTEFQAAVVDPISSTANGVAGRQAAACARQAGPAAARNPPFSGARLTVPLSPRSAAFLKNVFVRDYGWLSTRLQRKLGCRFNAEDIAAESFAQLAAKTAPEQVREPRALLTTIAQRLIYDMWRRRDLERAYLEALANMPEDLHPSPEDLAVALGTLAAIDRALGALSEKARRAFIYSQFDGLTYAEIAARLKVSPSMVRQYIAKALQVCYLAAD